VAIKSGLPREAMRSEHPSDEGSSTEDGVIARGAYMREHTLGWGCLWLKSVYVGDGHYGGVFAGRAFVTSVNHR